MKILNLLLHRGHYTAHVLNNPTGSWFQCNDTAVIQFQKSVVDNHSAYVLVFRVC